MLCVQETGQKFACKVMQKKGETGAKESKRDTVLREVAILKVLSPHPNVVQLKEIFEDKDYFYMVMELCDGGELFDQIVKKV